MDIYQSRLLAECIRHIEKTSPSDKFKASYSELSLEGAIIKRARLADLRYQILPTIEHLQLLVKRFYFLTSFCFVLLGATSASQLLITESKQLNFFWVFFLFIIPNILSLVVWGGLYLNSRILGFAWITNFSLSVITLLDKLHVKLSNKQPYYLDLFQFYFEHRFTENMGKRELSYLSHLCWSCYLFGATISLLMLLATHQVDFIWQTTILTESTFLFLTELLTYLPNLLSLDVPNSGDVINASIDLANAALNKQDIRFSWANLLFFSLIFYGFLPRVILAFIFYISAKVKRNRFNLNLSLPYYVQLKNILQPLSSRSFIKDPDNKHNSIMDTIDTSIQNYNVDLFIPLNTFPIAIELTQVHLNQANLHRESYSDAHLINAVDHESQYEIESELSLLKPVEIAVYVDIQRLPDRGWLSFINKCNKKSDRRIYIILLGDENIEGNKALLAKFQDWIAMASRVNIPAQDITYLINKREVKYE